MVSSSEYTVTKRVVKKIMLVNSSNIFLLLIAVAANSRCNKSWTSWSPDLNQFMGCSVDGLTFKSVMSQCVLLDVLSLGTLYLVSSHCVKIVRIRSYSGPHFTGFGLNTERYGVSFRIQSESGKMHTRITPNTDTFHAYSYSIFPRSQK